MSSYSYEERTYSSSATEYGNGASDVVTGNTVGSSALYQENYTLSTSSNNGGTQYGSYIPSSSVYSTGGNVGGSIVSSSTDNNTVNQIASDLLQYNNGLRSNSRVNQTTSNVYDTTTNLGGGQTSSITVVQSSNAGVVASAVEESILRSTYPIDIKETEEITVNGQRGIWANKAEVLNWRGVMPINEYAINIDANPEVITKRTQQSLTYVQELAIRYLRPPTPPAPGEIVITQEANTVIPPAPPIVIRQQPPRPSTPEPLVIREAPPQAPPQVGRKVITISGKRIPPPPRKVVIERLAPLPSKPQSVLIERWLPYSQVKRRVIFQKSNQVDPIVVKPRNVIIQWEAPQVQIRKEFKYLGIIRANPADYVQRYGTVLKTARELPDFVLEIKPPQGVVLAADYQYNTLHELEGDVQALRLIDLDREGLGEYRGYLQRMGISSLTTTTSVTSSVNTSSQPQYNYNSNASYDLSSSVYNSAYSTGPTLSTNNASIINELFSQVDRDRNGKISVEEAEKLLLSLNSRLGRSYGEDEVQSFFRSLDHNRDGVIDIAEFRSAFERLV